MSNVKVWIDDNGVAGILRYNNKLESMEREIMERRRSEVSADFLQTFGFQGNFEIKAVQTRPGKRYGRLSYRLRAADAKTSATLKRNPGWLDQFISVTNVFS